MSKLFHGDQYRKAVESVQENAMSVDITYTNLRQNLSSVLDQVSDNQEVVIIRRRSRRDVAMIRADELSSLLETAHVLGSPASARRLLSALQEASSGKLKPSSPKSLRREFSLERA